MKRIRRTSRKPRATICASSGPSGSRRSSTPPSNRRRRANPRKRRRSNRRRNELTAVERAALDPAAGEDGVVRGVEGAVPPPAAALHDEIAEARAGEALLYRHAIDFGADDRHLAELQKRVA